ALVILRRPEWQCANPVAQDEERHFRSRKTLLDHKAFAGCAKTPIAHRPNRGRLGRREIVGNDDALTSGEAIGLEHHRKPEPTRSDDRQRLVDGMTGPKPCRRDGMTGHEGLRERLAPFKGRGRLCWTDDLASGSTESI